jgi:hypothetical protein
MRTTCLIATLAVSAAAASAIACAGKDAACDPRSSAQCFVADFYSYYAKPADSGGAGANIERAIAERPDALSEPLRKLIAAQMKAASDFPNEEVSFDADPLLMSQDPCQTYVPGEGTTHGQRTSFPIFAVCNGHRRNDPDVIAQVERVGDHYAIANVEYSGRRQIPDLLTWITHLELDQRNGYAAHGACPFECCRYGEWTLRSASMPIYRWWSAADSIGVLRKGEKFRADSGIVMVEPVGIAVVTSDSLRLEPYPQAALIGAHRGDTLRLLNYLGEGYRNVRLRDSVFSMMEQWDSSGTHGAQLTRNPVSAWYVHVTHGAEKGWILMKRDASVAGSDACGG